MQFILNNRAVTTSLPTGTTLLDFIRYEKHLKGTKIGCREGDCGACTVLVGELNNGKVSYKSLTSCITPIANVVGKHVVTIEGLNMDALSPVQQVMFDAGATQCGFCTVGFVVSLSGYCLTAEDINFETAVSAVDGNICRCTGYKSIERAIEQLVTMLEKVEGSDRINWLVDNQCIPAYFGTIKERLEELRTEPSTYKNGNVRVGGGTDLYVQRHEEIHELNIAALADQNELQGISIENGICKIGASTTVTQLMELAIIKKQIPGIHKFLKLVSSTPIRNIATVAGNLVNASPIGDLTIIFLALNATLNLARNRKIALKDFYKGYKTLDLQEGEHIESIEFNVLDTSRKFNFEKVSKRTYLDIASVNTAIQLDVSDNIINTIHISAGGVGPIPTYLKNTCGFLTGKELSPSNIQAAIEIMNSEIAPISDARGTAQYKTLLLRQLFFSHFITLFPESFKMEVLA